MVHKVTHQIWNQIYPSGLKITMEFGWMDERNDRWNEKLMDKVIPIKCIYLYMYMYKCTCTPIKELLALLIKPLKQGYWNIKVHVHCITIQTCTLFEHCMLYSPEVSALTSDFIEFLRFFTSDIITFISELVPSPKLESNLVPLLKRNHFAFTIHDVFSLLLQVQFSLVMN